MTNDNGAYDKSISGFYRWLSDLHPRPFGLWLWTALLVELGFAAGRVF